MKIRIPWLAAVAASLTMPVLPALAEELIRFKSGYEMMVMSHREEGGMVFLSLLEGGEVGFPKEILDLIEGEKENLGPHRYRGGYNRVPGRAGRPQTALPDNLPSRVLAKASGMSRYNGTTVGYSYSGQKQDRLSGGPIGPINSKGRVGLSVWDQRSEAGPADNAGQDRSKGKKGSARTITAEGTSESE